MQNKVTKLPFYYLVRNDFAENSTDLTNKKVPKNIPVLIMMQSSTCPYCITARPEFEKFSKMANKNNSVFCATIQINGHKRKKQEIELASHLKEYIHDYKGVPEYLLYFNTKLITKKYTPGRSAKDLQNFCLKYTNKL